MSNQILSCCSNTPVFEIIFQTGEKFHVCNECFEKPCWSRFLKEKKEILN